MKNSQSLRASKPPAPGPPLPGPTDEWPDLALAPGTPALRHSGPRVPRPPSVWSRPSGPPATGSRRPLDPLAPEFEVASVVGTSFPDLMWFLVFTATSIQIPSWAVGLVIGKGGSTIRNVQDSTGATVKVYPRDGQDSTVTVVVNGPDACVKVACEAIEAIVSRAQERRDAPSQTRGRSFRTQATVKSDGAAVVTSPPLTKWAKYTAESSPEAKAKAEAEAEAKVKAEKAKAEAVPVSKTITYSEHLAIMAKKAAE